MLAKTEIEGQPGIFHLDEDVAFATPFGQFTVPYGFVWDLASKPKIVSFLGFKQKDSRTLKASLLHDFIYYFHQVPREKADKIYYHLSLEDGYPKLKAWVEYKAIRLFAGSHWKNDEEDVKLMEKLLALWNLRPDRAKLNI